MDTRPSGFEGFPIYLDHNSTTPVDPRVRDAALPYLSDHFGNPSGSHRYSETPNRALSLARARIARLIGSAPDEVVFTSGGSEADTLAVRGAVLDAVLGGRRDPHIITQATEHPAVLETCAALQRLHGVEVTRLPVDGDGRVAPKAVEEAITDRTTLISIMAANNETGVLQPVPEIARLARDHGVRLHTDAAQAVGKIPVDVGRLGVDMLTIAGHKMYGPKGIGALYVRSGMPIEPLIHGGGQEGGLRAGTENVALSVALGAAAEICQDELAGGGAERLRALRDLLHRLLDQHLPGLVHLNGHPAERLPGTLNITIAGVVGDEVLRSAPEVAAATGSACHAGSTRPSPVLVAMGRDPGHARGALRLSLGRWTTRRDVERAAAAIAASARSCAT